MSQRQDQSQDGSRNGSHANNAAPPPPPPASYGQPPPPHADTGFDVVDQPGTFMGRQLASWAERFGASLIDALLIVSPALAAMIY
ncbi:MAG TPA: hypothetical protein VF995_10385, partial [Actinomycetota bacterium]